MPVVWRVSAQQHLAKGPIGIVATFIRTLGVLIVYPGINNDFALRVITKKQTVLLEEFSPEPMLMLVAQGRIDLDRSLSNHRP
jgi:hypothetical protein